MTSSTLQEFVDGGSDAPVVVAICSGCADTHPLREREQDGDTTASTVCPECGGTSYKSDVVEEVPDGG